jgi:hypothetical protein
MNERDSRDRGAVLPLILVFTIVLSLVVLGIARYGTANLAYSQVTERRSDQLAAADAAMSYAVNLIGIGRADCIFDNTVAVDLPALLEDFNGATGSVTCETVDGGLDGTPVFAMALTGEGVPSDQYLVKTQAGSTKQINGPVYMERATPASFQLSNNNGIDIIDAPLVHSTDPCSSVTESNLPTDLKFIPDVFGPICTAEAWDNYGLADNVFDEPPIAASFDPRRDTNADGTPDAGSMEVRDGTVPIGTPATWPTLPVTDGSTEMVIVQGGYTVVPDSGDAGSKACRVFYPGRYLRPPVVNTNPNTDSYFMSGDYVFDFRDVETAAPTSLAALPQANELVDEAEFLVDNTTVIAGRLDTSITSATLTNDGDCAAAKAADTGYGATFYMSGLSHILVEAGGAMEIMPRNQGSTDDPRYVAIHALCNGEPASWCTSSPSGIGRSTLTAPSPTSGGSDANSHNIVYTHAGQPASMVVNGLIYAPKAELELENASSGAQARFKGGLVLARATLQAAASATNFEIGVTLQDIDFDFRLTATGTDEDGRATKVTSVLDYTYGDPIETAVLVRSWRVCESDC